MSHKELCYTWVERRKHRRPDGTWQECTVDGDPLKEIYATEAELDDVLWNKVIHMGIEDLI